MPARGDPADGFGPVHHDDQSNLHLSNLLSPRPPTSARFPAIPAAETRRSVESRAIPAVATRRSAAAPAESTRSGSAAASSVGSHVRAESCGSDKGSADRRRSGIRRESPGLTPPRSSVGPSRSRRYRPRESAGRPSRSSFAFGSSINGRRTIRHRSVRRKGNHFVFTVSPIIFAISRIAASAFSFDRPSVSVLTSFPLKSSGKRARASGEKAM
jgi:hypothetical protein